MNQSAFAHALLDAARPVPDGLVAWNGSRVDLRFAVYRNNVVASLTDALTDAYPVVQRLVGATFFRAMAHEWLVDHPPRSPVLAQYGEGFAAFIAGFAPAASVPYLSDVARLEWAYVQSFHAADATALAPAALAAALAPPEQLPALRVALHPSVRTLASDYAIVSLWGAHQAERIDALPDPNRAEAALLLRPALLVHVVAIDAGTHALVCALQRGAPLGEAAQAGADADTGFDLMQALAVLIRYQAFREIRP